ncbi:MAG: M56 family metallopeptidase [Clostridia bacterium]|nr:M56 family metallopeptidase [Clostridia bacterium]
MIRAVFLLLLLTVMFTVMAGLMLAFRNRVKSGCGWIMYVVWLIVLLLAVLPVRIGSPQLRVEVEGTQIAGSAAAEIEEVEEQQPKFGIAFRLYFRDVPLAPQKILQTANPQNEQPDRVIYTGITLLIGCWIFSAIWFVGFLYSIIREVADYKKLKHILNRYSTECDNTEQLRLFDRCCKELHIRRKVNLRIVRLDCPTAPCVCGFLHPTVYIGSVCSEMDDRVISSVYIHELCHVKRLDILYKFFALFVLSVHWFNPICKPVRTAIGEDNEMACDATVIHILGRGELRNYMNAILTVAEHVAMKELPEPTHALEKRSQSALFMAQNTETGHLKRRYLHMKLVMDRRCTARLMAIATVFVAAAIVVDIFAVSSCAMFYSPSRYQKQELPVSASVMPADESRTALEIALRNYYEAEIHAPLDSAWEPIDTVYVDYYLVEAKDMLVYVPLFAFNGEAYEHAIPDIISADSMNAIVIPALRSAYDGGDSEYLSGRFLAFYALKDPAAIGSNSRMVRDF